MSIMSCVGVNRDNDTQCDWMGLTIEVACCLDRMISQTSERFVCFVVFPSLDEPTWRFRTEIHLGHDK